MRGATESGVVAVVRSLSLAAAFLLVTSTAAAQLGEPCIYRTADGRTVITDDSSDTNCPKPVPTASGFREPGRLRVDVAMAEVISMAHAASVRHRVDHRLVESLIEMESGFDVFAVSRAGAMGLMQLMPATARRYGVGDPFDARQNVDGGVRHLRSLLLRYGGDLERALAAYNAGAGAVDRYQGIPPYQETTEYVMRVLYRYRQRVDGAALH